MTATARYTSENAEIDVKFSAETIPTDDCQPGHIYYVPDLDTITVDELYICGVKVDFDALPKNLRDGIKELSDYEEFE